MKDLLLDILVDSLKMLPFLIIIYILLELAEKFLADKISKKVHFSPLIGSMFGLVPQCGFSVIAADLYLKRHITMGTLMSVFIACSDEALPIMLSNPNKILMTLPLLAIKFVVGFIVGFTIDLIYTRSKKEVLYHCDECEHEEEIHVGCCNHSIESNQNEKNLKKYFWHPLLHSLKIFAYIFIINLVFGFIIYFIGEENVKSFLVQNAYLTPLFSVMVGLIPNCASSVILSNLYIANQITFGSCVAGLICNAGLGFVFLFKNKQNLKNTLFILLIVFITGLVVGYVINAIFGFVI